MFIFSKTLRLKQGPDVCWTASIIVASSYLETNLGTQFTIDFLIEIQIQWNIGFSVTPLWGIISLEKLHSCRTTGKIS